MLLNIPEGSPGAVAKRLKVNVFMGHMLELMDTLHYLCAVMHKTDIQSEIAINEFEMVAVYFGQICRRHFKASCVGRICYGRSAEAQEIGTFRREPS